MSTATDEQTVLFLHLPKTGGITLGCALRWQYWWHPTYSTAWKSPSAPDPFTDLSHAQRTRLRLVKGHVVYGLHQFLDTPCTYVTMIRDPVRRVLSLFYFIRQNWPDSEVGGMSLREYLESSHPSYAPNDQVCRIAGHDPDRNGPATEDTLDQAKKHIDDHFAVCGLTERFDESVVLMQHRLNWSKPAFYVRSNTNTKRPRAEAIDEGLLRRIRADQELDLKLHAYADNRMTSAIADIPSFERDLQKFQSLNSVSQMAVSGPLRLFRALRRTVRSQ